MPNTTGIKTVAHKVSNATQLHREVSSETKPDKNYDQEDDFDPHDINNILFAKSQPMIMTASVSERYVPYRMLPTLARKPDELDNSNSQSSPKKPKRPGIPSFWEHARAETRTPIEDLKGDNTVATTTPHAHASHNEEHAYAQGEPRAVPPPKIPPPPAADHNGTNHTGTSTAMESHAPSSTSEFPALATPPHLAVKSLSQEQIQMSPFNLNAANRKFTLPPVPIALPTADEGAFEMTPSLFEMSMSEGDTDVVLQPPPLPPFLLEQLRRQNSERLKKIADTKTPLAQALQDHRVPKADASAPTVTPLPVNLLCDIRRSNAATKNVVTPASPPAPFEAATNTETLPTAAAKPTVNPVEDNESASIGRKSPSNMMSGFQERKNKPLTSGQRPAKQVVAATPPAPFGVPAIPKPTLSLRRDHPGACGVNAAGGKRAFTTSNNDKGASKIPEKLLSSIHARKDKSLTEGLRKVQRPPKGFIPPAMKRFLTKTATEKTETAHSKLKKHNGRVALRALPLPTELR